MGWGWGVLTNDTKVDVHFKITGTELDADTGYDLYYLSESMKLFHQLIEKTYLTLKSEKHMSKAKREDLKIKVFNIRDGSFEADFCLIINQVIPSLLTAIAALVTAIVTYTMTKQSKMQLNEMKAQRVDSQRPALFINDINELVIDLNYRNNTKISEITLTSDPTSYNSNLVKIPIVNIGNGPARFIKVTFEFDNELLLELYNNDYYREKLKIDIKEYNNSKLFIYHVEDKMTGYMNKENKDIDRKPFLQEGKESFIYLPDQYKGFLDAVCSVIDPEQSIVLPGFYITLNYFDSYSNESIDSYTNMFYIQVNKLSIKDSRIYSLRAELANNKFYQPSGGHWMTAIAVV